MTRASGPAGFDLERFVAAQAGTYDTALAELRRGRKTSHWMWFVFPQLAGLGSSPTAVRYAVPDLAAARAYLAHEVLGPRLVRAMDVAATAPAADVESLLGWIDAVKLRSSATLFALAAEDDTPYRAVLDRWFDGAEDDRTTALLA